jgi:hypothetical protein
MARAPKFPELQQKFHSALLKILQGDETQGARQIVEAIRASPDAFSITPDEAEDLDRNFANYAARAKSAEVIVSSGPWGGYRLAPKESGKAPPVPSEERPGMPEGQPPAQDGPQPVAPRRQYWESLLHLPMTVALSAQYSARVESLPTAVDNVRWGNPDMLMLRPSPLARVQDYDPELDPKVFSLVDASPECILASIEIKKLTRDRAALFSAISEAAANSRWANEAWLAIADWEQSSEPIDEDVLSLARSVEVGLVEVGLRSDSPDLQVTIHYAAPIRSNLRIGELNRDRMGVLRAAQSLLATWHSEQPTFLDVDSADQKARLLLQQAFSNLRSQVGFTGASSLGELLRPLRAKPEDAAYVSRLLEATVRCAALAGVMEPGDFVRRLEDAADNALIRKDAEAFRADIAEMRASARWAEPG